jgi:hypothetical protein
MRLKFLDSLSPSFSACKLAYFCLSSSFSYNTLLKAARAANMYALSLLVMCDKKHQEIRDRDSEHFPKGSLKKGSQSFEKSSN